MSHGTRPQVVANPGADPPAAAPAPGYIAADVPLSPTWTRRLAAVGIGLCMAPLAGEIAGRLYPPDPGAALLYNAPQGTPPDMFRYDGAGRLVTNPGFEGHFEWLDHSVSVRFDSRGLRGPEVLPATPRWLAVGDSFVLARQVEEEDTFMAALGPLVGASVLNAGVDGYGTWDYLARYLSMDPVVDAEALLVTVFVGNDPAQDTAPPERHRVTRPDAMVPLVGHAPTAENEFALFRLQHERESFLEAFLFRHSSLFAWWRIFEAQQARGPSDALRHARFRKELEPFTRAGTSEQTRLARATGEALAVIAEAGKRRGDRVMVAVAPPSFALDTATTAATLRTFGLDPAGAEPLGLQAAVVAESERLGLPTCDLRPALVAAREDGREPYFRFEGHWNEVGHATVATALAACLGRSG